MPDSTVSGSVVGRDYKTAAVAESHRHQHWGYKIFGDGVPQSPSIH